MELTTSQNAALEAILTKVDEFQPLITLSGSAGTGKTTLISELVAFLGSDCTVCTPTNKAAQVLVAKGIEGASTFYKKFYVMDEKKSTTKKLVFWTYSSWLAEGGKAIDGKLTHIPIIIVDEASMVSYKSIREMRRMCDVLILVGDHHQLPPVGDREFPAGYFGTLKHDAVLTEVLRQKEGGSILDLAIALRDDSTSVSGLLKNFMPEVAFRDLVANGTQLIAFTNKERRRLNHVARRILGFDSPCPQLGDKMVVTNNFSDDLINGTQIDVSDFEWDGKKPIGSLSFLISGTRRNVTLDIDMRAFAADQLASQRALVEEHLSDSPLEDNVLQVAFAYCLTAHKAQGSEWPSVLVVDQRSVIRRVAETDESSVLSPSEFVRRWTYTAITRAKTALFWVAPRYAQVAGHDA